MGCTPGAEDEASLHARCRRRRVSTRQARETRRLCPLSSEHRRPIGSQGNLPQANLPNGRTATNLQGRTKFPSEEPSEENLGDYCLYRILATNDHLTRGRSQHLTLQALRQGPYRIICILVLLLLDTCHAHNPLLQSHIGDSKIHTPPKAYIRRPLFPKEGTERSTVRYRLICNLIFTKPVLI